MIVEESVREGEGGRKSQSERNTIKDLMLQNIQRKLERKLFMLAD